MGAGVDDDRWDENIINIHLGLNGTVNKSIGVTPSQALMVYRVVTQGQLEPEDRETADVTAVRARMAEGTAEYQAEQKRRFDRRRCRAQPYVVEDLVMIRIGSQPATGTSRKLLPKWRGPFKVVEVLGHDRYKVADIPGTTRSQLRYSGVAAAEHMKPWIHYE
jgi:hypothetical protein